jgi:hypothetical protein
MHQATLWGTAAVTRPEVFESPADVLNKLVDQLVEEPKREQCKQLLIAVIGAHSTALVQAAEARFDEKLRRLTRVFLARGQCL